MHTAEKRRKLMEDLGRKRQLPIELTARKPEMALPTGPTAARPSPERHARKLLGGFYGHLRGGLESVHARNELDELWNFEDKLVEVFYHEFGENRAVDSRHKLLQIFARAVKSNPDQGGENRTLGRR